MPYTDSKQKNTSTHLDIYNIAEVCKVHRQLRDVEKVCRQIHHSKRSKVFELHVELATVTGPTGARRPVAVALSVTTRAIAAPKLTTLAPTSALAVTTSTASDPATATTASTAAATAARRVARPPRMPLVRLW